jgi:hypothetical protein
LLAGGRLLVAVVVMKGEEVMEVEVEVEVEEGMGVDVHVAAFRSNWMVPLGGRPRLRAGRNWQPATCPMLTHRWHGCPLRPHPAEQQH